MMVGWRCIESSMDWSLNENGLDHYLEPNCGETPQISLLIYILHFHTILETLWQFIYQQFQSPIFVCLNKFLSTSLT